MKSATILLGLAIPALVLAADHLNVKTGLWEVVSSTQTEGLPQIPAGLLEKMTPAQRAQMAKAMDKGPHLQTRKECVTEKDLERPFKANEKNCKTTVVKSSATYQEINLSCEEKYPTHGKMRINTPTPESMNGDIEITVLIDDKPMVAKSQLKGKWLGASCKGAEE